MFWIFNHIVFILFDLFDDFSSSFHTLRYRCYECDSLNGPALKDESQDVEPGAGIGSDAASELLSGEKTVTKKEQ